MAVELYTLSFICVLLLVIFIPVPRVHMSVPHLAFLVWLAGINLIRGINALVWDGNVELRIPVWCDIATKFMLGSNVALPAAFLCISRKLELLGSSRTFSTDSKAVRNRRLLELFLCYVVPVIYVGLHPVSQDHRFDLAKDYGCSPSIHNSSLALAFIWIPPLILCSITLAFSCYSMHHTSRVTYHQFVAYIESRTNITSSIFFRQLSTSFVMTAALIIAVLFSVFSAPALVPYSSWDAVHFQLWKINVVTDVEGLNTKRLEWWIFFSVSVLYIFLLFTIGEEARDAFRWVIRQLRRKSQLQFPNLRDLRLPLFHSRPRGEAAGGSKSNLVAKYPAPSALTLELKSGWDDMLDSRTSKWKLLPRKSTPSPSPPSPTPSNSITDEDKALMTSTLSYLGLPTAKPPAISSPPHIKSLPSTPSSPPQPAILQPRQLFHEMPSVPRSPPPPPPVSKDTPAGSAVRIKPVRTDVPPENVEVPPIATSPLHRASAAAACSPAKRKPVPTEILPRRTSPPQAPAGALARMKPVRTEVLPDNASSVSSVLGAPWPAPPTLSNPDSPDASPLSSVPKTHARSASRSYSPTSSEGGSHGVPVVRSSNRQVPPMRTVDTTPSTVKKPLKSALKRPSGREEDSFQGGRLRIIQETS